MTALARVLVAAQRLDRTGGMERYLEIVLPALAAGGVTVHVLAREISEIPPGVTAACVPWADEHDEPDAAARAAVVRAIAEFGPDLAVAHNVLDAGVVEALRGVPRLAYHVHDYRPFCPNGDRVFPRTGKNCSEPLGRACAVHALTHGCAYGPRPRTLGLIRRRERLRDAIARSDVVVAASRYVADRTASSGVPRERIVEIPLPLPDAAYAGTAHTAGSRTVVFAGRIVPQKGLGALVRALATIDPAQRPVLRAFGDGPALEAAREDAERAAVTLDAPGPVLVEVLRQAIDAAQLVVLPSLWAEPFGYMGIEAFARGRPVVAFAGGGIDAWLAPGRNGLTVPLGDERALGAAIARVIADDPLRATLGTNARADAERFRLGAHIARLRQLYSFC